MPERVHTCLVSGCGRGVYTPERTRCFCSWHWSFWVPAQTKAAVKRDEELFARGLLSAELLWRRLEDAVAEVNRLVEEVYG